MHKIYRFWGIFLLLSYVYQPSLFSTSFVEVFTVLTRYVQKPNQVGEIAPMARHVGLQLARFIGIQGESGCRYLEVGGGCGAVSVCLAERLRPQDHLDVIEVDPKMCSFLRKRLARYDNVTVHCCNILDWNPPYLYDVIVSTLPFNSLGSDFTTQFLQYLGKVAKANCMYSYVEYPIVRQVLQHFYGQNRKQQFQEVQKILKDFRCNRLIEKVTVYFNVPPVTIYHLIL